MTAASSRLDPAAIIAGCLAFAFMLFMTPILGDADTLWQISAGTWILDHRAIPTTDPFSFSVAGAPWSPHEWLSQAIMALVWRSAGMAGVMGLAAACFGFSAAVILLNARHWLPGPMALLAMGLAIFCASNFLLARPHLLAWPCLTLWTSGLLAARREERAPTFWLLPVMLVWVNMHGSFMAGLLLPGAFLLEALLGPGADRPRVLLSWSAFIAAAWAVALCNPDGLAGTLFPLKLLGMHSLVWIVEWQPTNFSVTQPLEIVILGAIALGAHGRLTLPPVRLILFLGLIHAALSHGRNGQLLGLVGSLILAEPMGRILARGAAEPLWGIGRALAVGSVGLALAAAGARAMLPVPPTPTQAITAALLDRLPRGLRDKPVFNEYGLGGALIFNGVKTFVDGRTDLFGDAFLTRYQLAAQPDRAILDGVLADYRIAWTLFPAGAPILSTLDVEPGWHRLIEADDLVVHVRDTELPR
jgi:hypothetical protein